MSTTPRVFSLRCSQCGSTLRGLTADAVFFCPDCPTAHEVTPEGLRTHPLSYAQGERDRPGEVLYLPFWVHRCRVRIWPEVYAARSSVFGPTADVFVKGCLVFNTVLIGNPGLDLTRA